ncbi:MAG: hypothetical protein CMJ85_09915 [Planctomycetes bacterium]|jgi:amidohydrolase|nr:hypothetical protein [Planctomycetota bacterium]MDP6424262.1 amidohydrolase [Planctomycetota bacterium]
MSELVSLADRETPEIVRLRRDFHQWPELSFREQRTAGVIAEYLRELGLDVVSPDSMHGMWADLQAEGATKTLALRADMDALAMDEASSATKSDFVSKNPGAAHCCGHDSHMAMLMTAARLMATGEVKPRHNIRFLFQHAEEKAPGGAIELIEAGCLEGVDEVYGIHVIPPIETGKFVVCKGPFMAAADEIHIRVTGKGGHAAMPHLVRDPIVAAAHVITALQGLVSRRTSPLDSMVVTISTIRGGSGTTNVIPNDVELLGTVRTLNPALHEKAPGWVSDTAKAAAAACGCEAEVEYGLGYPVLVNDDGATATARECVRELLGESGLVETPMPMMGGEDFARYAELRPSCYVFLGVGSDSKGITSANHATDFDVDEAVLHRGTAWFLQLAVH